MSRTARVVILCEDVQSWIFLEHALVQRGYDRRSIRVVIAPPGRGSGEQYVREHVGSWVRFLRAKRATRALVVHIDADQGNTVADRHRQLDAALAPAAVRGAAEPVAYLVPKRNIETWIHLLRGVAVDETTSYPKFKDREGACGPEAVAFAKHAAAQTQPANATPSMVTGLAEFRRVP